MTKWNKTTFLLCTKLNCQGHITNVIIDLVKFAEKSADIISWGRGKGFGTMTFKCKSEDLGILPLFHITTEGQIKILLNNLRSKIRKKEILKDFQLKLESNFLMDFSVSSYSTDIFYNIEGN